MPQGHHLNFRGSEQLIKNLNIPVNAPKDPHYFPAPPSTKLTRCGTIETSHHPI